MGQIRKRFEIDYAYHRYRYFAIFGVW